MKKIIIYIFIILSVFNSLVSFENFSVPINLEILNSEADEFAPSWNQSEFKLYFNSTKTGKSLFYHTNYLGENLFSEPILMKSEINPINKNQSYITFTNDNVALYSTFVKGEFQPHLNIHYSKFHKQNWNEGFRLEELKSDKFTAHPTVSPDGKIMVFSMQSDKMDTDLFISYKLEDGRWKAPFEIENINSNGNEITPFLKSSDTLYFSSDGQSGMGGFDIFMSINVEGEWQRPTPLFSLNTEYNESDFIILPWGDMIFSSDRPDGKGGYDLYMTTNSKNNSTKDNKELSVSINSYISSVQIVNNYNYVNLPVPAFIKLDSDLQILDSTYFKKKNEKDIALLNSFKDIQVAILSILGTRMNTISNSKLEIVMRIPSEIEKSDEIINSKNSKFYADQNIQQITDFLTTKFNITSDRISYSYKFYKRLDNESSFIEFKSNEPRLFEQIEFKENDLKIIPENLFLFLKIEENHNLRKWEAKLRIGDKISKPIYSGVSNNKEFDINIVDYANELLYFDDFRLIVDAYNNEKELFQDSINFFISTNSTATAKLIKDSYGELNEEHFLYVLHSTAPDDAIYKSTLNKIYASLMVCKSAEIAYDENEPQTKEFVLKLKKIMELTVSNPKFKIDTYSKLKLENHLIRIRIRK